jgi:hypothetical protein
LSYYGRYPGRRGPGWTTDLQESQLPIGQRKTAVLYQQFIKKAVFLDDRRAPFAKRNKSVELLKNFMECPISLTGAPPVVLDPCPGACDNTEKRVQMQAEAVCRIILETSGRELANSLPQTVFEMDSKGVLTFANRTAMETFG